MQNIKCQMSAEIGRRGEEIAEEYLKNRGFKIIARNYRSHRWGEIDRIAIDKDTLVFVEVRTRMSSDFLTPQESITRHKISALKRAAHYYFLEHEDQRDTPQALRIDFVGVTLNNKHGKKPKVEHFVNITHGKSW